MAKVVAGRHGIQKERERDSSVRPILYLKSLNQYLKFQNGIHSVVNRRARSGRVSGVARRKGCIFASSDMETSSGVPSVHRAGQPVSILSSSIRTLFHTLGFYQDHGNHVGRTLGNTVILYLDHLLLKAPSPEQLLQNVLGTCQFLLHHGRMLNFMKSQLKPFQQLFLGLILDTAQQRVFDLFNFWSTRSSGLS